jgi:hypothetical protein
MESAAWRSSRASSAERPATSAWVSGDIGCAAMAWAICSSSSSFSCSPSSWSSSDFCSPSIRSLAPRK